tara:strand:- start:425 stop:1168 length:744 start_codon:yes stop_codon:yes gene_type:complete
MESLKTKTRRVVVPKKKKAKKKLYFGMEVQDAIIRYNGLDPKKDQVKRNKIYQEEIHKAFDKLCENIINTFKFEYFDDVYVDVKHETLAFLVMNMHKYDGSKGSKAFSYFSVVAKNYLILHNNANYKKYKSHYDISALSNMATKADTNTFLDDFLKDMISYFEQNISVIFKNKTDVNVAYAIIELFKNRDGIENFNKKSLYILIREMTDVNTSQITRVTNVFKKHYKKLLIQYDRYGTLKDEKNKFF